MAPEVRLVFPLGFTDGGPGDHAPGVDGPLVTATWVYPKCGKCVCACTHVCMCVLNIRLSGITKQTKRSRTENTSNFPIMEQLQNQWASERLAPRGSGKKCLDPKWLKTGTGHPDSFRD